jgi:hypothetical protein
LDFQQFDSRFSTKAAVAVFVLLLCAAKAITAITTIPRRLSTFMNKGADLSFFMTEKGANRRTAYVLSRNKRGKR